MGNQYDDSSREDVMEQLRAMGYIDPGAGSSILQIILAGFFRISARIRSAARKLLGRSGANGEEN